MHDVPDERLTRLEEAVLFADRRLDELHGEVVALGRRLDALAARIERLERAGAPSPGAPDPPEGGSAE